MSITEAELLEASEDKEDVTGDISGDAIKDVTEEGAKSDTNAIKERRRGEVGLQHCQTAKLKL